jgi:hypothetical protein
MLVQERPESGIHAGTEHAVKKPLALSVLLAVWAAAAVEAKSPPFDFQPAEKGYYSFDTGLLRGKMRLDGTYQGIASMVYVPTGKELLKPPGVMSYYRVLTTGFRYGAQGHSGAARDWPVAARLVDGGDLEIRFPPAADHPMELTGTFRWRSADTLDVETTIQTPVALPRLELFLSSYFVEGFDALVYVQRNRNGTGESALLRADWSPLLDGNYLMFPRDEAALRMIYDGRWDIPPNPVTWAFLRWLAAPIAVRRHAEAGLTAAFMSPPADCFAMSLPYNKQPPDGVASHRALYLSLFGRDLAAGQTATARCRLIVAKNLSDQAVLERYQQYLREQP